MADEPLNEDTLLHGTPPRKSIDKQPRTLKLAVRLGRSKRVRSNRSTNVGGIHQRRNRRMAW